jgi:hypothetical protein
MCAACGRATSTWLVVDADGRVTGAGTSNGADFTQAFALELHDNRGHVFVGVTT